MLVDTHCHLHFDAFDADREAVIQRAQDFGVKFLVNVGTDLKTNEAAWRLSKSYPFMVNTAGLHPHHAHEISDEAFKTLEAFVADAKPAAIGEIGLDYFKSQAPPEAQKKAFARMLRLAADHGLPVIVHSRNAFEDTLAILKSEGGDRLRGVVHCFSYDREALKKLLDFGFLVSFTCNLTFKNAAALLGTACAAPLDRMMLETDSPYLAPQIYRGKRNEPCCLTHLADFLSEKRGIDRKILEDTTTRTAAAFFKLPLFSS
jgi:TatD DNase family protein